MSNDREAESSMNKRKRMAWKKHRIKRKKYEEKMKQQRQASMTTTRR